MEREVKKGENMNYRKYTIRTCRTLHYCNICHESIRCGELYYDGGENRRVHRKCNDGECVYCGKPTGSKSILSCNLCGKKEDRELGKID